MKKKKPTRPARWVLTICVSLVLHVCLFSLGSVNSAHNSRPSPRQSDPFALVNIGLIEPAVPPPPLRAPPRPEPPPPPEVSDTQPEDMAENLVPVEEFSPVITETEAPVPAESVPEAPEDGLSAEAAALTAAYVKQNYDYVQRRIREKLVYPAQARQAGLQGTAELSFTIHEDGSISDVTVTRSSGSALLDTASVEAIYAAAPFRPPPSPARIVIPVGFRLR